MTCLIDEQSNGACIITNKPRVYMHTFNTVRSLILCHSNTVPWNGEALIENNLKTLIFLLNQPHSTK